MTLHGRTLHEARRQVVGRVEAGEDEAAVEHALDNERHRQRDGDRPRRRDERSHAPSLAGTARAQRVRDAMVAVQRDGAQVHDGRGRQRDVTSGPREARVEAEIPVTNHLRAPSSNIITFSCITFVIFVYHNLSHSPMVYKPVAFWPHQTRNSVMAKQLVYIEDE